MQYDVVNKQDRTYWFDESGYLRHEVVYDKERQTWHARAFSMFLGEYKTLGHAILVVNNDINQRNKS